MIVKTILWQDKDTNETDAIIEDNGVQMRVYIPNYQKETELDHVCFTALGSSNIVRVPAGGAQASFSLKGPFTTTVVGCVDSLRPPCVRVNNLLIELDSALPHDISEGDCVSFEAMRITMYYCDHK